MNYSRLAKQSLEALTSSIKSGKNIDALNQQCEDTESLLNSLKNYEPINPQERREHAIMISNLQETFQSILSSIDTKPTHQEQKITFEELNNDIFIKRKEQTERLQKKMETVKEIMVDCSETANSQGKLLDRIDAEISVVDKNTTKTVNQLEKTQQKQKFKRGCCLIALIISSCILIGVIVVAFILGRV